MIFAHPHCVQRPLIHEVDCDDRALADRDDLVWYESLRQLNRNRWRLFAPVAAKYYECLWLFNDEQAQRRAQRSTLEPNTETKSDATLRLVFDRATMSDKVPALFDQHPMVRPLLHVNPNEVRPGIVPLRFAGRQPKCFFAMFDAFVAMTARGIPAEPETVYDELISNPAFARACGFTIPQRGDNGLEIYRQSDFPKLRKIEQFDQIMTDNGLWGEARAIQITSNFATGIIKPEKAVVHDTTHYKAYSGMCVVEVPSELTKNPSADLQKKSHPKTTKNCRCAARDNCPHEWISADDGAGTVVKHAGKMYWAHKASTMCLPGQEVLIDAVAMTDAASHDSQCLHPHIERIFKLFPPLEETVERVLDDGAADDAKLKDSILKDFGIELLASINPRARKSLTKDLPRGIDHITPTGTPICNGGIAFNLVGCRHQTEHFIFQAPKDADGNPVCFGCPLKDGCYRGEISGRTITVAFARLPWINPNFPQLSRRFKNTMAKRTTIERMHKLMKFDFGDDRLTKRGTAHFQARLDKTLLVMHIVHAM